MSDRTDSNLVSAWGIAHSATGPWWVNANGAAGIQAEAHGLFGTLTPVKNNETEDDDEPEVESD